MEYLQVVGILRDRLAIVILGAALGLLAGWGRYTLTHPVYKASTTLVVDVKTEDPLSGTTQPGLPPNYIATQLEIIRSERVAKRVVSNLKLSQVPAYVALWQAANRRKPITFEAWAPAFILKNLAVVPARDSDVFAIEYTAEDPALAQAMADGFAQAYIETTVDIKVEPARQYAALFDQQVKSARERVVAAQARLSEYQRAHGVVAGSDRLDSETQKLNELQAALVAAEAQSLETRSRFANSSDTSPDVMQNGVVQGLRSEVDRAEAKLAELSSRVGTNNPSYIRAQSELSTLKERLAQETRIVTSSVSTSSEVSNSKLAGLRGAVEAQRRLIMNSRNNLGDYSMLSQDVESAQKFYESISQRYTQSSLQNRANQANLYVLNPATRPRDKLAPILTKLLLAGLAAGAATGIALAVLFELLGRKVRSVSEITDVLDINFLGELSQARRSTRTYQLWRFFGKLFSTTPPVSPSERSQA